MKKNNEFYLHHIAEAIEKIEKYLAGITYEIFSKDSKTLDAVVRELEIIGEAANCLEEDFILANPDLPIMEMIGTRNRLIHEYFGVDEEIVWETINNDLPKLKKIIQSLLVD